MVVAVVVASMVVLVALTIFVAVKLDSWQGARFPRRKGGGKRGGKHCPSCGGFFSRVVESDDRLNGYRECRGCHFTWDPEAR